MINKKQRKYTQKKKKKKTITRTRQYLRGSAICLRPWSCRDFTIIMEEYRVQNCNYNLFIFIFSHKEHDNTTQYYLGRVGSSNQIKQNQAPQSPTNLPLGDQFNHQHQTAILQITIPHPYNSSSCPQARRPIEAVHNFNFSIVTLLVSMSAGFLNPQIFSSITNLSSTR